MEIESCDCLGRYFDKPVIITSHVTEDMPNPRTGHVHIDQDGGVSINIDLFENHINALVTVETVRVVLRQFEPVLPYFEMVLAMSASLEVSE